MLVPSESEAGAHSVRLAGFGTLRRAGAPAVPVRIERVAIPPDAAPRLRVLQIRERDLPPFRLETVPSLRTDPGISPVPGAEEISPGAPAPRRPVLVPDPALLAQEPEYPDTAVRLGATGWLRDQRFVEVIFTPLRVSPRAGSARLTEEVEVEIAFGGESARTAGGGDRAVDPRFDAVYEQALRNPEQGRRFRDRRAAAASVPEGLALESSAGTGSYRVTLRQEGIYRITCTSVPTCGVPDLLGLDPATFRLRNRGVEVPIRIVGGGDGSFDLGDSIEFFGQPVVEPFTIPNCTPPTCIQTVHQYNDVTDVNAYLLDAPGAPGRVRMATVDGTPGGLAAEPDFVDTAHWEVNDRFLPLNDADPFYSIPTQTATETTSSTRDISVPLPGLASAGFTAPVTLRLRGVSSLDAVNPDHRTRITVNAHPPTTATLDWDGEVIVDQATTSSQSNLTNPTTVRLEVVAMPGVSVDQVILDFVEISYRRAFQAVSDRLAFRFANQAAKFTVTGLSGSGSQAYDVSRILAGTTGTGEPRIVANGSAGPTSLTFQVASEGAPTPSTRRFFVVGPGGYLSPETVAPLPAPALLDPTNEADYIILAHPSLVDTSPGSAYSQFVNHLTADRGLSTRLVSIQDVYDCFNDSISHPEAIRSFLAYAHANWTGVSGSAPPPAYLLLLGDAVWDPKNNLNRSDWVDLVPTPVMFYDQDILKYHAADNWLASYLGGDQAADILHGRIPARTVAQAEAAFAKILAYATAPPAGSWRSDGYFLADVGNDPTETDKFELVMNNAAAFFVSPWTQTKQYYAKPPYNAPTGGGIDPTPFRNDFVAHTNTSHPAIAGFAGHGAFDIVGNDIFFRSTDVPLLTNGAYQSFFFNSDCLTGGFHAVGVDAIGEAFLLSPSGGSIGFFAPAGLSFTFIGNVVGGKLFGDLFAPEKFRGIGTLAARARDTLYQQGSIVDLQGYALLGDPALDLVLPAPRPPGGFAATPGNARVDLSWTASTDPSAVGVNVYRTTSLTQPYVKVNPSPVTTTTYADLTVVNGTTYFYRAVAVDAGGFEGAVTNTNADCGSSPAADGPQCRRATPLNPNPPAAPQGARADDTGTGTTLEISWNANPEPDIARYMVYYGTAPDTYTSSKNAGLATSTTLFGLSTGVTYYVAVAAVNTSGLESAKSAEVSAAPSVFLGIAPPRTIDDLTVTRAGDDLVLSWSAVTTDIYGIPSIIEQYNVYRGSAPSFVPDDATNRIGVVAAGPSPSFVHPGGALLPDAGHYLVSAVDSDGFASGLGGDLPAGVVDLIVEPSPTPGMLRISWPPVTTTVSGGAARVSHYRLHGAGVSLPRALVGPGNLLSDSLPGPFLDVPEPGGEFYYNLIVVDARGNLSPY